MIGAFHAAMDRLDVERPHHMPRVTEYVDKIIAATGQLIEQECAYRIPDGVAFRSCDFDGFGQVLGRDPVDAVVHHVAQSEWGGRENAFDFILWRSRDDLGTAWETPWGAGRPGWHTECAVMATELLGPRIDLHGGGTDLVFPHHECERAIATCLTGEDFCDHWVHNGLVTMGREKMSKSLKNYVMLADAIDEHGPACVRVEYLLTHYRETLEWRKATLDAAHAVVEKLAAGLARAPAGEPTAEVTALSRQVVDALRADLDTPRALAALVKIADEHASEEGARAALTQGLGLLGLARLPPFGGPAT
jgi:cysteinyl-tRNA synthetase